MNMLLKLKLFLDMKVSQVLLCFPSQSQGSSLGAAVRLGSKVWDAAAYHRAEHAAIPVAETLLVKKAVTEPKKEIVTAAQGPGVYGGMQSA